MYEKNLSRNFESEQELWTIVNEDGTFAGLPFLSYEEAKNLMSVHPGSRLFKLTHYKSSSCEEE